MRLSMFCQKVHKNQSRRLGWCSAYYLSQNLKHLSHSLSQGYCLSYILVLVSARTFARRLLHSNCPLNCVSKPCAYFLLRFTLVLRDDAVVGLRKTASLCFLDYLSLFGAMLEYRVLSCRRGQFSNTVNITIDSPGLGHCQNAGAVTHRTVVNWTLLTGQWPLCMYYRLAVFFEMQ